MHLANKDFQKDREGDKKTRGRRREGRVRRGILNCPHIEIKLKQNSLKTASKLFCFSFTMMCEQF